jgi:hypothetical protein
MSGKNGREEKERRRKRREQESDREILRLIQQWRAEGKNVARELRAMCTVERSPKLVEIAGSEDAYDEDLAAFIERQVLDRLTEAPPAGEA